MLIFFPSYPLLHKCTEEWQASGIWAQINRIKPIFTEPRGKDSFLSTMTEYYAKVRDPACRGAIFMAVCRGKVSEGLDFADANGRAVMITGLPFPPMMDARVVLKKQYLDTNRTRENELITGNEWYSLEASRAVNQAIGRVIRHKDDYGAILLCDSRFQNQRQQSQLSAWIHSHLRDDRNAPNFGTAVGEMARFFRMMAKFDVPAKVRELGAVKVEGDENLKHSAGQGSSSSSSSSSQNTQNGCASEKSSKGLVTIYKRERKDDDEPHRSTAALSDMELVARKKRKIVLVPQMFVKHEPSVTQSVPGPVKHEPELEVNEQGSVPQTQEPRTAPENRVDFLREVKCSLDAGSYKLFLQALAVYNRDSNFVVFMDQMVSCLGAPHLLYLLRGKY
uniref:ATP-dependent helicase C-terminal domain-containing protein n=1 Tax=Anopheles culicifacies TaxID=139723 RepID=A0A182MM14_9DIPT